MSLSRADVAEHNSEKDAWIIIDGDVYDVTRFANVHPGGRGLLLEYAGKDATEDFFGLHRLEVLDKYARLKKGRLRDAGPGIPGALRQFAEISSVPFGDAAHLQGMKSPFFGPSHLALRRALRKFYAEEVYEEAMACEATDAPPSSKLRKRMGELGIVAMLQGPGEHLRLAPNGLMGGVVRPEDFDYFHELVLHEERSRTMCVGFEDGVDSGNVIGVPVILKYGEPWMKDLIIPKVFSGQDVVALAISEAFAGSDVAALRSRAAPDASGESYVVNGTKKWITCGMYADWFVTAVRTGKAGAGGISMLLVPRCEGVQTKIIKSKYSSAAGTAYVTYEDVVVPKKYLFGKENGGFQIIMSNFNHERWMICACAIAHARVCTEEVFKWSMQRKVFGNALSTQPVIREKLAQMFGGLESCTSMLYDVTYNMQAMGPQSAELGSRIALLKYLTTRMCHLVADNAVQVLGGRGVTQGGMGRIVDAFHRTYKVPAVYGGSEEIMADLAVRQAIKAFNPRARL